MRTALKVFVPSCSVFKLSVCSVFTVSSEIKHNNCSCACNCLDEQVPSGKLLEAPNTPNSNAPKRKKKECMASQLFSFRVHNKEDYKE